jgi:thymidylate synthase ThyX
MKIQANIILDSIDKSGQRLVTMEWTYPRFIHSEIMTHRALSKSASSSRAIPVKRLLQAAMDDPAFFVHIGSNQPGMQASSEVSDDIKAKFYEEWVALSKIAAEYALRWSNEYGIHKQVVNRVMEPWHHIKVIVSGTDWDNFLSLRAHPMAQPEFHALALKAQSAMANSIPNVLEDGEWHLPYVTSVEKQAYDLPVLKKISTARCARVSYMNHDGSTPDIQKDIKLHDDLVGSIPLHASPAEHLAFARSGANQYLGNFRNWSQYRKELEAMASKLEDKIT